MISKPLAFGLMTALLLTSLLLALAADASNYYVDAVNGSDGNDGTNAGYAWRTLTKALEKIEPTVADPATIHLAEGTYSGPATYETLPVILKNHVTLVGKGPERTIFDACGLDHHVFVCDNAWGVTIKGVTVRGAHALYHGASDPDGGSGILCNKSMLVLDNCVIEQNAGMQHGDAGGICCSESELTVRNSIIRSNRTDVRPGPGYEYSAGGLYCYESLAHIQECAFEGDSNGAIHCESSEILIEATRILNNTGHSAIESRRCDLSIDRSVISNNRGYIVKSSRTALTMVNCLVEGNVGNGGGSEYETGMFSDESDVRIEGCVIRGNIGIGAGRSHYYSTVRASSHGSLALSRCALLNNESPGATVEIGSTLMTSESELVELTIEDTLLCGNLSEHGAILFFWRTRTLGYDAASDASIELRRCTIVGNKSNGEDYDERYVIENDSWPSTSILRIQDCVVWANDGELLKYQPSDVPYEIEIHNCCLRDEFESEGNIVEDPLFVRGPLGDYYLSSVGAGQDADSPCIDTGSASASAAGVGNLTTRTDGAFDTGVIDIGYHYSATPPTIQASVANLTNPSGPAIPHFAPGETLSASVAVENGGLPLWLDTYAAFILPDGALVCVSPAGLTAELVPWAATSFLPAHLRSGDVVVFEGQLPYGVPQGTCAFAAALSLTGNFRPIGDIAFSQFAVGSSQLAVDR